MKATKLLTEQHAEVKTLLERLPDAAVEQRRELFEKVASVLVAHDAIERKLFYPAVEAALGMTPILGESLVEHGVIEFMLYRTDRALEGDEFSHEATVLVESVLHHAREEEEELFPEVEKAIDSVQLAELGEQMAQLFAKELKKDFRQGVRTQLEQVLAGGMKTDAQAERSTTKTESKPRGGTKAPANGRTRASRSHA